MKAIAVLLTGLLLLATIGTHGARAELAVERASRPGDCWNDLPPGRAGAIVRADTSWYGDYQVIGDEYYARSSSSKLDVMWTFDRGNGPTDDPRRIYNGEGWKARDFTLNTVLDFRAIDSTLDLGPGVPPPIIAGQRSLWVGADKLQADSLCWKGGPGYGNNWCQRVVSRALAYNGNGDVVLSFKYFNQSETCFDGTQVYLMRADDTELLLNPAGLGACPENPAFEERGGFTDSLGHYSNPAFYTRTISRAEIGDAQEIRIIIEFASDGGWSDEDAKYTTTWGPFGADDLTITGGGINESYDFENGLGDWTPGACAPKGHQVDIVDVGCYTILDPCHCRLRGNILEMHEGLCDAGTHPVGQHVWVESPICDFGDTYPKTVFMDFDLYAELPQENGVLIRPGWKYYPWVCDLTGAIGWSPRIGQSAYNYFGADPNCSTWRYGGTEVTSGTPIPRTAEKVIALIELLGDCSAFSIANCSGETNATPLFDNIVVGKTAWVRVPVIAADIGGLFQDVGSYPSDLFDPRAPGPINTSLDRYPDDPGKPDKAGDSLVVTGPLPGNDPNLRWEARLWFRVAKRAVFQSDRAGGVTTRYKIWKDRVCDGKRIDRPVRPEFTWGWMDSVQYGSLVYRNKFLSCFREDDDDFVGEGNPENEILWDDAFFPGAQIEYFVTSNYVNTPGVFYCYPDTAGRFFCEVEVLPGCRLARVPGCGGVGSDYCVYHPATLYIDAHNRGSQFFIENALRTILNGLDRCLDEHGCPIPKDRNWDRYDYDNSCACFNVPFARGAITGSDNGMTLKQLLGYRAIIMNTGSYEAGTGQDRDFELLSEWLQSPLCDANANRQVFLFNGDKAGEILDNYEHGQVLLNDLLGAVLLCDAFNGSTLDPDCGAEEDAYCVRWLPAEGGRFGTELDVDAYGNACPDKYGFNVYSPTGTGVGNRYYEADGGGGKIMHYGQIVNEELGLSNYRTVLDGVSWDHMTKRSPGGVPDFCPRDVPSGIEAVISEIGAAMKWGFGVGDYGGIPKYVSVQQMAQCFGAWPLPGDVGEGTAGSALVNRLYPGEPNPFNPRTTLKFSLAQNGAIDIRIYDVNGRLVKTLVDGTMDAGSHSAVWDGTDDQGHRVGSGIFWAQMKAGSYVSNKKLVLLK